jgi:hypothetical protein
VRGLWRGCLDGLLGRLDGLRGAITATRSNTQGGLVQCRCDWSQPSRIIRPHDEPPNNLFFFSLRAGLVHPRVGDGLTSRSDEPVASGGAEEVVRGGCLVRGRRGCCGGLDSVVDGVARDSA